MAKLKMPISGKCSSSVLSWGLRPSWVTGDCWYSSRENLKLLKHQELGFLMGIAKNRQVSQILGKYTSVSQLDIPPDGLVVYLKKFGWVKVFRKDFKNEISLILHYVSD